MRRFFLLAFITICGYFTASGQYKLNKTKYDSRDYSYQFNDTYNPLLCGVASYFLPGLGQIIAGETGRGLTFTSIYAVGGATAIVGFLKNPLNPGKTEIVLLASGMTIATGALIWSIIDAVKVAKINNLAYRDRKKLQV